MKTPIISLVVLALALSSGCNLFKKRTPVSQSVNGTIAPGDRVLSEDNSLYDDYAIDVESGWTIHAVMTSDAFDTYLILLDPQGNQAVYNDDDVTLGGNRLNSQISFTTNSSGVYHLYANGQAADSRGAYQLSYQAGPPGAVPAALAPPPKPPATTIPGAAPVPGAPSDPIAPVPAAPAPIAPQPIAPAPH
jgi:hypothetical protein